MKLFRIAVLILFLLSTAAYVGYRGYGSRKLDAIGPEIEYHQEALQVSVTTSEEELLQGVTAFDGVDQDVTKSLLIESVSDFIGPGKRLITYAAFDSSNNITKCVRELTYTDYTPPRFIILKPLRFALGTSQGITGYLQVLDCIDGDITDQIKFEQPDYYFGALGGSYPIEFRATNSAGDTAYLSAEVEFY